MAHPYSDHFGNGKFAIPEHDYQIHTGTTSQRGPTQVVYKKGGANGKVVATETITYDSNNYIATRSVVWAKDVVQ
jgi:hypothetical protein